MRTDSMDIYQQLVELYEEAQEHLFVIEYFVLGNYEYQTLLDYIQNVAGLDKKDSINLTEIIDIPVERSDKNYEMQLICTNHIGELVIIK